MTESLYLEQQELLTTQAKVIQVSPNLIILDQTIFYPKGGGQPADQGRIIGEHGIFAVRNVVKDPDGNIQHEGEFLEGTFTPGETVSLEVEEERRTLNTRIHSAGHLLDHALESIQPHTWIAGRGYHYPEGPYVAYEGQGEPPIAADVEAALQAIIATDLPRHTITNATGYRQISFGDLPQVGCGGTHVPSTGKVGTVALRAITYKKGTLLIKYAVA